MPEIQEQNTGISKISEIKNNPDKISQIIEELGLQGFSKELLNLYNSLPDDKENNKKQELIKEIEDNKEEEQAIDWGDEIMDTEGLFDLNTKSTGNEYVKNMFE